MWIILLWTMGLLKMGIWDPINMWIVQPVGSRLRIRKARVARERAERAEDTAPRVDLGMEGITTPQRAWLR